MLRIEFVRSYRSTSFIAIIEKTLMHTSLKCGSRDPSDVSSSSCLAVCHRLLCRLLFHSCTQIYLMAGHQLVEQILSYPYLNLHMSAFKMYLSSLSNHINAILNQQHIILMHINHNFLFQVFTFTALWNKLP